MVRDRESEYQILNWRKQEPRDARDAGQLEKCAEASRSFRSVNPINVCSMHAMAHANPYFREGSPIPNANAHAACA